MRAACGALGDRPLALHDDGLLCDLQIAEGLCYIATLCFTPVVPSETRSSV
jgi:hypothetical protein